MKKFEAVVSRSGKWWFVKVTGVDMGFTQAATLTKVEEMVTDLLVTLGVVAEDEQIEIAVRPDNGEIEDVVEHVREVREAAARAAAQADEAAHAAVGLLVAHKLPVRDIALLLDRSPGWVSAQTSRAAA